MISANEVKGLLLLGDIPTTDNDDNDSLWEGDLKAMADRIAFECQPCVVLVPDLSKGRTTTTKRVNADIQSAAAVLRERYGTDTLSVFGMGYGGGRALDSVFMKSTPSQKAAAAAAGASENNDGLPPPPPVNPHSCVAWYPTKFDLESFTATTTNNKNVEDDNPTAVMAVFAGDDILPGATREVAAILNDVLGKNNAVKDHLVKVRYF